MGLSTCRIDRHKTPMSMLRSAMINVEYEGKNRSVDARRDRHLHESKECRGANIARVHFQDCREAVGVAYEYVRFSSRIGSRDIRCRPARVPTRGSGTLGW
jgi:hypothetical protein